MSTSDKRPKVSGASAGDDTEGHGLMVNTTYSQRRLGRMAEHPRELRQRREAKETRPNRPDRD